MAELTEAEISLLKQQSEFVLSSSRFAGATKDRARNMLRLAEELAAAKAENERLRGLLEEVAADGYGVALGTMGRIRSALAASADGLSEHW